MATLGALLPHLQRTHEASAVALAALVTVLTVSASALQPALGALALRLGARLVITAGAALAAVSWSLMGIAESLWLLAALVALGGLGSAAFHPVAMSVVTAAASGNRDRSAGAAGSFTAAGLLGFALGPLLVVQYTNWWGVRQMYWLMVPGLILAVLLWQILPADVGSGRRPKRRSRGRGVIGPLAPLLVASTLQTLVFLTYLSAMPLWLTHTHDLEADSMWIGLLLSAFTVAAALGAMAGGALGDRWGYRRTSVISLTLATAPLAVLLIVPTGPLMIGAAMAGGMLVNMAHPLFVARAQQVVPWAPSIAAGVVMGVASAIAGVIYLGVGGMQSLVGYEASLWAVLGGLLPTIVVAWWALVPRRSIASNEIRRQGGREPGGERLEAA